MKILPGICVANNTDDVWETAIVQHGKQSVEFPLSFYGRLKEGTRCFRDFNNYLAWYSQVNPPMIDKLMDLMVKAHKATSSIFATDETHSEVHGIVREILNIVTLESVALWMRHDENIVNPDISEDKSSNYKPEQTYNLIEYDDLVRMTIVLKVLVPIWGAFTPRLKKVLPGTTEERLLSLIKSTDLEQSAPFIRHRTFVDTVTAGKLTLAGVLDGISTTTLPKRCFAAAIVNKLAIIDLTWESDLDIPGTRVVSIVANTHRYIKTVYESINKGEYITGAKIFRDKQSGEEDNTSIAENYTVKEDVPEVSKVFFDYYGKDYEKIAKAVLPDINMDAVTDIIHYNRARKMFVPTEVQYKLVSLVMAQQIGVRSLPYTNRESSINIISIAQEVAYELGYPNIAALMGATTMLNEDFDPMLCETKILRAQVRQQQIAELNTYYPYKKKNKSPRSPYKNPAEVAIEQLASKFANYVWLVSVPEFIAKDVSLEKDDMSDGWLVREDFRPELADFFIEVNRTIYK
ncbi:hypothetical protein NRE35_004378 [Salmonella enterica]|nr:hypothetical protein [Salmonella enterica]ELF5188674.1 hypothetical protein [Salmonella enterica]